MSEIEAPEARFRRRGRFVAIMLAPVIGYGAAELYEHWAVRQAFLSVTPLVRIPLGLASLALGGWVGFRVLDLIGSRLSRLWGRRRAP